MLESYISSHRVYCIMSYTRNASFIIFALQRTFPVASLETDISASTEEIASISEVLVNET